MISNSLQRLYRFIRERRAQGKKKRPIIHEGVRIINNSVKKADILNSFKKSLFNKKNEDSNVGN